MLQRSLLTLAAVMPVAAQAQAAVTASADESTTQTQTTSAARDAALAEVVVTGKLSGGTGLIAEQNAPRSQSSVDQDAISKTRPSENFVQEMALLPDVNIYMKDASGIFGGGYSVRGFDSTQIGFSLNGVPLNDPGTTSVVPQIYTDSENTCSVNVVQGSTDSHTNAFGAVGGNININICAPTDQARLSLGQTVGTDDMTRTFFRINTGLFAHDAAKAYVSYSHSQADIFNGPGGGDRDHLDLDVLYTIGNRTSIGFVGFLNQYDNNLIRNPTLAQYNAFGYNNAYLGTAPSQNVFPSTTANSAIFTATTAAVAYNTANVGYYNYYLDEGRHALASLPTDLQLTDIVKLTVTPYYYWQYAGSTSETVLSEAGIKVNLPNGGTRTIGVLNLNGDPKLNDKDLVAQWSNAEWWRAGAVSSLSAQLGNHLLSLAYWGEYDDERQFNPYQSINTATNRLPDPWFLSDHVLDGLGEPLESRNYLTTYVIQNVSLSDTADLLDNRLHIDAGLRAQFYQRAFSNYAVQESAAQDTSYEVRRNYFAALPSVGVRYGLDDENQLFVSAAEKAKVPGNQVDQNLVSTTTGKITPPAIKQEKALNIELGYRLQNRLIDFSASLFYDHLRDRDAETVLNNGSLQAIYTNAGATTGEGLELELGTRSFHGWSAYWSGAYDKDRMDDDILATDNVTVLHTKGKQFFNVPLWSSGMSVKYEEGPFYGIFSGKYTDKEYSTLTNDQSIPGVVVFDLSFGYQLNSLAAVHSLPYISNPTVKLNLTNLLDRRYLYLNPGSTTGDQITAAGNPNYWLGPPRAVSVTLAFDF